MNLFLDDERFPHQVRDYSDNDFYIARNFHDAIGFILLNKPQFVSFDHDIGTEINPNNGEIYTGKDVANWMVNADMEPDNVLFDKVFTRDFKFVVHSENSVGGENIQKYINNYMMSKFG